MRFASRLVEEPKNLDEGLHGELILVSPDNRQSSPVPETLLPSQQSPTLLWLLHNWDELFSDLKRHWSNLCAGSEAWAWKLEDLELLAPLPAAREFLDGSAFISHIERARKARNAAMPAGLKTRPLMYQGSANFSAFNSPIPFQSESYGLDLESELAVFLKGAPLASTEPQAAQSIVLVGLLNDISLRGLIPEELATQFGFLQGKPPSSFAPIVISRDELEELGVWQNGRANCVVKSFVNDALIGEPNASAMHFSFPELIVHASRTRELMPGTVLGSGTVSEPDASRGGGCLAEKRILEQLQQGEISTHFLRVGDRVEIYAQFQGHDLFGKLQQRVVASG